MNIIGQTISALFALTILVALGISGYFAIEYFIALFFGMEVQVAKVTAIASVVVLLAATLIASSIRQASQQNKAEQSHTNKAATYMLFISTWCELLRKQSGAVKLNAISLTEELQALNQQLALHGSPAVVKAHIALRATVLETGTQNSDVLLQFSKALKEMRKDIGSDTGGLTQEELRGLVLADSESIEDSNADLIPASR